MSRYEREDERLIQAHWNSRNELQPIFLAALLSGSPYEGLWSIFRY